MLDAGSTVLARRLRSRIEEERKAYTKAVVDGAPADFAGYKDKVGYLRALRNVEEWIDTLSNLEPIYRVFGRPDGRGMVIRSSEPVAFNPTGKLVNVVEVPALESALQFVTVATQSVGVYPAARIAALRDGLSQAGAQRIVGLGCVNAGLFGGLPHDGTWPVHRMMRWVVAQGE